MLKHLEPLSSKRIKQHLTVGEQAEGRVWCQMQHLVPAPWLCPESHPRTGARLFLFSQFGGKWLLVIFFRRMSLDAVQKVYSGVMSHHFVIPVLKHCIFKPGHGNTKV